MDYTAKLLKSLYDIVELLKDIKKQNNTIIRRLENETHECELTEDKDE